MIKGAIWSCDRGGDGIEKLKYIRDRYIWSGINPVQEVYSRSNSWIAFENGDHWKVVGASESSRGVRCNYAWIDSRASEEFVRRWSGMYPPTYLQLHHREWKTDASSSRLPLCL